MKQIRLSMVEGKLTESIVDFDLPIETEQEKIQREIDEKVNEYLSYLDKTDKKVLPHYEPKEDEDILEIIRLRTERRRFIRENRNV